MSDMHPESIPVKIGNKTYGLRFTMNAIDAFQTHYGKSISEINNVMFDKITGFSGTRYVLTQLINEGIACAAEEDGIKEPPVKEDYVGRHALEYTSITDIKRAIFQAFKEHIQLSNSGEDNSDPNPVSE